MNLPESAGKAAGSKDPEAAMCLLCLKEQEETGVEEWMFCSVSKQQLNN